MSLHEGEINPILDMLHKDLEDLENEANNPESWPAASETDFSETAIKGLMDLHVKLKKISELDSDGYILHAINNKGIMIPGPNWLVSREGTMGKAKKEDIIRTMGSNATRMNEVMEWFKPNIAYKNASNELREAVDDFAKTLEEWDAEAI